MHLVTDMPTKRGDRVGQRPVKSISPKSADKIYEKVCTGPRGPRPRQGEKLVALCRAAWRVVRRLHPDVFDRDVPNPWDGVTKQHRVMKTKPAATREHVYRFAWGAIEAGRPEAAAAAVVCFEFLQRPENVLAGYLACPTIKIRHHKTGAIVWHPLEERTDEGTVTFYAEAEAVLARLPRRGARALPATRKRYAQTFRVRLFRMRHSREFRMAMAAMMRPLPSRLEAFSYSRRRATWRSGYATVCKTVYPGSIPGVASNPIL